MNQKDSSVERWKGHIVIGEYMTFPQLLKWEKAIGETRKENMAGITIAEFYSTLLPCIFDIVKEWHIEGMPENPTLETFPASMELITWLVGVVTELYRQTNGIDPNS